MEYTAKSLFGRPMSAALQANTAQPAGCESADKWHLLDALTTARTAYGLGHTDLAVLSALLSFHPGREISVSNARPIVFASNRVLCDRLNGMPDSTMRRHLSRLLKAGIVSRHDSPNGKRYVRRSRDGTILRAFGIDLTPLVARAPEICAKAEHIREASERLSILRETVSLMRRDLEAWVATVSQRTQGCLTQLRALLEECRALLRRRPRHDALTEMHDRLDTAMSTAVNRKDPEPGAEEMSTSPRQNEQHYQKTDKDLSDSDRRQEIIPSGTLGESRAVRRNTSAKPEAPSLTEVVETCPTVGAYFPEPIRRWDDIEDRANRLAPMMGIGQDVTVRLKEQVGGIPAAIAILCMLERLAEIRNPAGYLRRLAEKAAEGKFVLRNLLATVERGRMQKIVR